jgi:uncharacterized RmlC-like cupin family protein
VDLRNCSGVEPDLKHEPAAVEAQSAPFELSRLGPTYPLHRIGRVTAMLLPTVSEASGELCFAEAPTHIPFDPTRMFSVRGVPPGATRGGHAHREVHELLMCVQGTCRVFVHDGKECGEVVLDRHDAGLYLPPLVWATQFSHSTDAILAVLASHRYDPDEYLTDGAEFDAVHRGG